VSWDEVTNVHMPLLGPGNSAPTKPDAAYLVVLAGAMMGEMFRLTEERTVIGRGQKADIRILDDGISREHCEIVSAGGRMVLRDLGSTNGTFCKGVRVKGHELGDGDKILVGSNTVLKFTYHDQIDSDFQRQMYESALRDDLTKAFNKKYFMDRIESEFAYSIRHQIPLTLISFDLDHFKKINDTHGHLAGDYVLTEVSSTIISSIRVEDVFARVGGEEFTVICRGTPAEPGLVVAERLRTAVERRQFTYNNKSIPVTLSVGMATVPGHGLKDAVGFMSAADKALYAAKHGGRNKVCVFS